jgi:hypothetical protein
MANESDPVWATLAVLVFTLVWRVVNRIIGPKISVFFYKKYLDFDGCTRLVWNTYVTSTIHSVIVCSLTVLMLRSYPEVTTTERQGPGPKAYQMIMAFSTGYFLSDVYVLIRYDYLFGKKVDLIHHIVSVVATFYVAVTGHIPFWGSLQILHEFSTPVVNLRWFLLTCGIGKDRRRYTMVCFLMLLAFFLCRILPIPYFWYSLVPVCYMDSTAACNIPFIKMFGVFFLGMDLLNIYWFRLMISVFYRASVDKLVLVKHKIKLHFRFQEDEEEEYHDCDKIDTSEFNETY